MARNNRQQGPKPDYAARNAEDAKTTSTAIAIIDAKLGSGVAAKFNAAKLNDSLRWQTEKVFVHQIFQRNVLLCKALIQSPTSLVAALQSAASLGLTLDPSLGLAYLVPKRPKIGADYEVQLKISYKGMEQVVLASGTVTAITTELVFENDEFDYGVDIDGPFLKFKMARGERGELQGGFCLARYANGERHVEWMPVEDINACEAAAKKEAGDSTGSPWFGPFRPQMQKKSVVRRAASHWPKSPVLERLIQQHDIENPMDFSKPVLVGESVELLGDAQIEELNKLLSSLPPEQADTWLQLKAKAEGYDSIRDVPMSLFEKVRDGLAHRLKLVQEKAASKNKSTGDSNEQQG